MKTSSRLVLAGAALLAAAVPLDALAQPGARPAAGAAPAQPAANLPHKVGLVDMGYVFTNYAKMKDLRKTLQEEFEASTGKLKETEAQLKAIQEEMTKGTIAKGSDQWVEKEQEFTNLKAQYQAEMSNLQRQFARKEIELYKEAHAEISKYIAFYAKAYKYTLILRYTRDAADAEAAEDQNLLRAKLNQMVVYHQVDDDITEMLLAKLNEQYTKAAGAAAAPTRPATR